MVQKRIYMSPPHMSGLEQKYVQEAFDSNWLAPLGPNVDAFEQEFCEVVGSKHALALSSGTAALHLGILLAGVGQGDEVLVSTYTFCASVNPILYCNGYPTFLDCERESWNLDPNLLEDVLKDRAKTGNLPKALVLVHLYGQSADIDPIMAMCDKYGVAVVEDAAEVLGTTYKDRRPGTFGQSGAFSFNGNKIITTTGGGMLTSDDADLIAHARKLSTQARDPAPHYQHTEIGYNYRMSNVLAGIGRGQLQVLEDRVQTRRGHFEYYQETIGNIPGVNLQPEAEWGKHTRWHICATIDPNEFGATCEDLRLALESENIEARPTWKPMHLQPVYDAYESVGGAVSEDLFDKGICLPSGSSMTPEDLERIITAVKNVHQDA